jgi:hypothetical protein
MRRCTEPPAELERHLKLDTRAQQASRVAGSVPATFTASLLGSQGSNGPGLVKVVGLASAPVFLP